MNLDQETWESWGETQQEEFERTINHKLERYSTYEGDEQHWADLAGSTEKWDDVYPVPLDSLP